MSSSSPSSTSSSSTSSPHDSSSAVPLPPPSNANAASAPQDSNAPSSSSFRRSTREFGESSSSRHQRLRTMNEALPEALLEILAAQVATDASNHHGRLAAAPAVVRLFQVCSTWRGVSNLDHLWHGLTMLIWRRAYLLRDTWREEYIYWHRTARNFALGAHSYRVPHFDPSIPPNGAGDYRQTLLCRCLALSDRHLACGFADGTVRLFDVENLAHVSTFRTNHGPRFGPFSRSVSGIILSDDTLTFARIDGDVFVAAINMANEPPQQVVAGDVVNNGVLVEFAGNSQWWVGLYAGLPGRAFQIWDALNQQLISVGGTLTDPETVMGWHMLTELVEPVGRVRVTEQEYVVACTSSRLVCFSLRNPEEVIRDVGSVTGFVVSSLDARHDAFVVVERNGVGTVRRASTFERLSRFRLRVPWIRGLLACINMGYVLTYSGVNGVLRVWNIEQVVGVLCCNLPVRAGDGNSIVANERHVAISWNDTFIHLLDFGV
ncbi:hypothetical protein PIB30_049945 [Stylosanthes scabra]|uniref:Transcriptional regulator STERILE APETALA n=1 Tax=Stylosanthes scabra TaxID=79078 RepID=A0ABU6THW2_9FABA|nr:hypothetical protein [Stylosanthes scabra]